jgi:hypothetical protein
MKKATARNISGLSPTKGMSDVLRRSASSQIGYNNGKYNVGKYSLRGIVVDFSARCIQRTTGTVTIDNNLVDFRPYFYQRTPVSVLVESLPIYNFAVQIIQTEPCFVEWQVLPPFELAPLVEQPTPTTIPVQYYTPNVEIVFGAVQNTPVTLKAALVCDGALSIVQTTPVQLSTTFCHVSDAAFTTSQLTVFVPGVVASWSPWFPINPDYPAPWKPAQQAA